MVFCNNICYLDYKAQKEVTILILIDGFLQSLKDFNLKNDDIGHNPYFNRWFSAITNQVGKHIFVKNVTILILIDGFLQYGTNGAVKILIMVTILILIDGFLQ